MTIKNTTIFNFDNNYYDIEKFISENIIKTINNKKFVKYLNYDCLITFIHYNERLKELIIEYENKYDEQEVINALRDIQNKYNDSISFIINNCVIDYETNIIWSVNKYQYETNNEYQLMKLRFDNENNQKIFFELLKQNKVISFIKPSVYQKIKAYNDYQSFKQAIETLPNQYYDWLNETELLSLLTNTKTLGYETLDDLIQPYINK